MKLPEALARIRAEVGGSQTSLTLTDLGQRLRVLGWVRPNQIRLSDILADMPAFCTIEDQIVTFLGGDPVDHGIGEHETWLDPVLFRAMTLQEEGTTPHLDLKTLQIVRVEHQAPDETVAAEPERYVPIPILPVEQQITIATQTPSRLSWQEDAAGLIEAGPAWLLWLRQNLPPVMVAQVVEARQQALVRHATDWLTAHGIAPARFIRAKIATHPPSLLTPRPSSTTSVRRRATEPTDATAALRQRLHVVIDHMTLAELSTLPIPARFLLS